MRPVRTRRLENNIKETGACEKGGKTNVKVEAPASRARRTKRSFESVSRGGILGREGGEVYVCEDGKGRRGEGGGTKDAN